MKKLVLSGLLLSVSFLTACASSTTTTKQERSSSSEVTQMSSEQPKKEKSKLGESYTYTEKDQQAVSYRVVGLKLTIEKVEFKDITTTDGRQIRGAVITYNVENTSQNYIDLFGMDVIDSKGNIGKFQWVPDVSSQSLNGIDAGVKANITMVYEVSQEGSLTMTFAGHTWNS